MIQRRKLELSAIKVHLVGAAVAALLVACGGRDADPPAPTPLPTKQTTIDPVTKKLDSAREDAERRRLEVDNAYK